jgi:hypothetical protein
MTKTKYKQLWGFSPAFNCYTHSYSRNKNLQVVVERTNKELQDRVELKCSQDEYLYKCLRLRYARNENDEYRKRFKSYISDVTMYIIDHK